eukprot:scaffold4124_cov252-Pinguiococcus_pyrenoidosus.AAC.4
MALADSSGHRVRRRASAGLAEERRAALSILGCDGAEAPEGCRDRRRRSCGDDVRKGCRQLRSWRQDTPSFR